MRIQPDKQTRRRDREMGRQGARGDEETERQGDRETRRQGDKETRRQGDRETGRFARFAEIFVPKDPDSATLHPGYRDRRAQRTYETFVYFAPLWWRVCSATFVSLAASGARSRARAWAAPIFPRARSAAAICGRRPDRFRLSAIGLEAFSCHRQENSRGNPFPTFRSGRKFSSR